MDKSTVRLMLIRHAQTLENLKKIYQGQTIGGTISPFGKMQIVKMAKLLKDVQIDNAYTSPLNRAFKTASGILKFHNWVHLRKAKDLAETSGGIYEGKATNQFVEDRNMWKGDFFDFRPKKGESLSDTYSRSSKFIYEVISKNEGKTVLIVTHHNVLIMLVLFITAKKLTKNNFDKIDRDSKSSIFDFVLLKKGRGFRVKELLFHRYGEDK